MIEIDAAGDHADQSTDSLDDLAVFLLHRAYELGATDAEPLETFAVVNAYQEGDEPSTIESAMRTMAPVLRPPGLPAGVASATGVAHITGYV